MSIAEQQEKIKLYLTDAYNACNEQKATIPSKKNLQSLGSCIRSIKGGGGGGESTITGNLPMPVAFLKFTQTPYLRGKGKVSMLIDEKYTESIDLLIKKNGIPNASGECDQIINVTANNQEIEFKVDENGHYAYKYGMWAVPKNSSGLQTALNNSNKIEFDFMYADLTLCEAKWEGALTANEVSTFSAQGKMCVDRVDNLLFISAYNSSNTGYTSGLFVLDMDTNELKRVLHSGNRFWDSYKINEVKYFVNSGENGCYEYNHATGEIKQLWTTSGYNMAISTDEFFMIKNQAASGNIKLYDKSADTWTDLGLPYHKIIETSQGIFAYCSYGASSNYARMYKFNSSTKTFRKVEGTDKNGNVWDIWADYTARLYEDRFGTVWACANAETATPTYFDGTYFNTSWEGVSTSPNFAFQNPPIFRLGNDECFITGSKVWAFKGSKIEAILTTDGRTRFCDSVSLAVSKGGRKYIRHSVKSSTTATYGSQFFVWKDSTMEYNGLNESTLSEPTIALEIQSRIFLSGGGTTYEVTGNEANYGLVNAGSLNIDKVYEFDGSIYATKGGTNVYRLVDGVFKQITTASGADIQLIFKDGLLYIMPIYKVYNTSAQQNIKTYNPVTEEVITTDMQIRYHLGAGNYVNTSAKTVYDIPNSGQDRYFMPAIDSFSNGVEGSADYNLYSNYSAMGYATQVGLTIVYVREVLDLPKYTVTFDTDGGGIIEPQTVTVGYVVMPPASPTKAGYIFKGWQLDGEDYDFNTRVTGDITLTAVYERLTFVEYIESNGTQYIDTGFAPNQNTSLEIDFEYVGNNGSNSSEWLPLMGSRTSNSAMFALWYGKTTTKLAINFGNIDSGGIQGSETNTRATLLIKDCSLYKNGTLIYSNTISNFTGTVPIILFGVYNQTEIQTRGIYEKIYSCKIYDGDTLVRDFKPALDSNGVACLYDTVTEKYFYNQGTGTFTAGTEV